MNFIKQFAPLLAQGVQLTLILKQEGDKINVAFLPSGKENKAGIVVPTQALLGHAEELDTGLEEWLAKYVGVCNRITNIATDSDASLRKAEEEAQAAAKSALEAKKNTPRSSTTQSPTKPAGKKPASLGVEDGQGDSGLDDGDDNAGGGDGNHSTTLNTSTPPAPEGGSALTPDLF